MKHTSKIPKAVLAVLLTALVVAAVTGLAVPRAQADLLVSSFYTNSVLRYDETTGTFIDAFVPPGSGGLNQPMGLAFGPDGHLYVASAGTGKVLRYDGTTGAFLDVAASSVPFVAKLAFPTGLAFGPDGNLYVTGFNPNCCAPSPPGVLRYNGTTGAFIDIFISPGSGGLSSPRGLTFGPDGNLYVASDGTDSILRFSGTTGTFIDAFVPPGSGGLDAPFGLVFGPDGNLYVSSWSTTFSVPKVLRYNGSTGTFMDVIVPTLHTAGGVVFGPDGNLYVSHFTPVPLASRVLRYNGMTEAFMDVFVPEGSLTGATFLTFTPPVIQADQDGDGISNLVDGEFVGGVFIDQSTVFSDSFTDQHLGGTSFGSIVDRGGLAVTVKEEANPAGLLLGATGGGAGTATVNACGALLSLTDGDSTVITCGSLTTQVLVGPIEVHLGTNIVATVPSGTTATFTEVAEGQFEVENSPESTAPIVVEFQGQVREVGPAASVAFIEVAIDIKPGSFPNSMNPRSKGVIPVAVLTTTTFDATTVDPLSVKFGPKGAMEAHGRGHSEDVNGDGKLDLVLHFNTQDTGIMCGDTSASLTGETFTGQVMGGGDSVKTVGCK